MGTIHQPKPSEPKSIQPDQQPLSPGQVPSKSTDVTPSEPNFQTPDGQRDKFGDFNDDTWRKRD